MGCKFSSCDSCWLRHGLLNRWTDKSSFLFSDKWPAWGLFLGTQITHRGWIFWTVIFYNLAALLGFKARSQAGRGKMNISVHLLRSPCLNCLKPRSIFHELRQVSYTDLPEVDFHFEEWPIVHYGQMQKLYSVLYFNVKILEWMAVHTVKSRAVDWSTI